MIEEREELTGELIASGEVIASLIATKGAKGDKGDKGDTGNPGADGSDGADGISPIITTSKSDKTTTITIVDAEGTKTATIVDGEDGTDGQDGADGQDGFSPIANVTKSGGTATITITDAIGTTTASISDGIGDMTKSVYDTDNNGIVDNAEKVNNHTVAVDVPADAVFTDTTYTAGTNVSISAGNVISATDTTYTAGTGIDITGGVISNTQTSAEWGNISGTLSDQTDLNSALGNKANTSDLATVATSGSYNDLSNKPTIMSGLTELSYGSSTWNDFITAYNNNQIVYCRASSNDDPASGSQTRKAFMAYVNNETNPTNVQFQYIRSMSSHTATNQGDQVFVYTLTNANGGTWSVVTREMSTKIVAGTGLNSSYSSGVLTLTSPTPKTTYSTSTTIPYAASYTNLLTTTNWIINNSDTTSVAIHELELGHYVLTGYTDDFRYKDSIFSTYSILNDTHIEDIYKFKPWNEATSSGTHQDKTFAYLIGYNTISGERVAYRVWRDGSYNIELELLEGTAYNNETMLTSSAQTITGLKTFNTIPNVTSGLTPSSDYHLATKKYVDDLQTYSTTETQIGTYLGKPLYRKVIVVESDVVKTLHGKNQEIAHNISNMDETTFYSGRFVKEDGTSWVFGDKSQTTPYTNIRYVNATNIVIDMPTGDTWNTSTLYVIVEYTKTTD